MTSWGWCVLGCHWACPLWQRFGEWWEEMMAPEVVGHPKAVIDWHSHLGSITVPRRVFTANWVTWSNPNTALCSPLRFPHPLGPRKGLGHATNTQIHKVWCSRKICQADLLDTQHHPKSSRGVAAVDSCPEIPGFTLWFTLVMTLDVLPSSRHFGWWFSADHTVIS